MKKSIVTTALLMGLFFTSVVSAQVGIGVSPANINPSAQLDVSSTTKGFLPPRMTEAERNAIAVTPASAGLIVYCTNCGINGEMQYYNGQAWTNNKNLVKTTTEPMGANCATGGIKLELGLDANANAILDAGEVISAFTKYVCNGTAGSAGAQGPTGATGPQGIQGVAGSFPAGTAAGQMNYWNGSAWVTVAPGTTGQTLTYCNGVPTWGSCPIILPTLTSTAVSSITSTAAVSGGNISNDGGGTVSARGVCWGTTSNPLVSGSRTTDGTGTGAFTSSISGLSPSTTYYTRAYATNSSGTSYGNVQSFTTAAAQVIAVGQAYQGGIIAYVDGTGLHGLIAATEDQSAAASWYNGTYTTTGATGTAIGTGLANTNAIIASQGNTGSYAAKICRDYRGGGYSDWYLPSINELNQLYTNYVAIGGFTIGYYLYCSSTEVSIIAAKAQMFNNGLQDNGGKNSNYGVRAVRSF